MKKEILVGIFAFALLVSCGGSSSNDSGYSYDGGSSYETDDNGCDNPSGTQPQMVQCPMCGGTGIFDYMPGDFMAPKEQCPACNGNGICDMNTAQQAIQARAQAEALINGGGYSYDGGYCRGRSAAEIEYDLSKAYDLLQSMEEDYRNCSSRVIAAQYPSMIANQKERIRQLEAELRNAQ